MKIKILLIVLILSTSGILFAQAPISKGKSQFNAGVGFSTWGIPVYAGFDVCVYPDVTVGGEISYRNYHEDFSFDSKVYKYNYSLIGVAGNGNYHFNTLLKLPKKFDLYAGLNIGFVYWSLPDDYHGTRASGLGLGLQVGGRYYFSNHFGLNLEFGGGNVFNGGKFGISIPF